MRVEQHIARTTCQPSPGRTGRSAYMMMECLVYIGLVFVVLGTGYAAMYHCIDNSLLLRRNADDIAASLQAGERWRADIRASGGEARLQNETGEQVLRLRNPRGEVQYRFSSGAVSRRIDEGAWATLLENVNSSTMTLERREKLASWRWDLELKPRMKGAARSGRLRPLFTFVAVPATSTIQ